MEFGLHRPYSSLQVGEVAAPLAEVLSSPLTLESSFNKVISLNDSAAWLWEAVSGKDFDADTLTGLLLEKYDVERRTAAADARKLLATWQEAGLLE